jgi:predicted nucleic acid-binding protein
VDASVAVKWQLADEEHRAEAERLRQAIKGGLQLWVPAIWHYELASVFSKAVHTRRLDEDTARDAVGALIGTPFAVVPPPEPMAAFALARRFNRSIFDCFYLAIAEERACDSWTDDRKLARTLSPAYPFVRWIGDFPEADAPAP